MTISAHILLSVLPSPSPPSALPYPLLHSPSLPLRPPNRVISGLLPISILTMASSKSTHKSVPQTARADPQQSHSTALELARLPELTYEEINYRHRQIHLRTQEIALAKAEREFREEPWWNFGLPLSLACARSLFLE